MNEEMDLTPAEEEAVEAVEEPIEEAEEEETETRPRLVLKRDGAETEHVFPFACPATIGRFDPSVGPIDVDLGGEPEGSYVSRKHAKITEEDGVYTLEDLGSSNGTYVLKEDFEKVESAAIEDGDEIALGNARFVFHVG
jgi:pSer/pThr/pTyr-binding forkhead associated (FHA) protein